MQALHYLVEVGDAQRRLGRYHLALKTYYAIQKVQASLSDTLGRLEPFCFQLFHGFREEQYDFHLYSLRRSMLGSYVACVHLVRPRDTLHQQLISLLQNAWLGRRSPLPSYIYPRGSVERSSNASLFTQVSYTNGVCRQIWIQLYDDPSIIKSLHPPGKASSPSCRVFSVTDLSVAEPSGEKSKKALNKAKKAAHKATADTSQDYDDASSQKGEFRHRFIRLRAYHITIRLVVRAKQNDDKGLEAPPARDDDPEGLKLVTADDPLERANKFLGSLGEFGKDDIDVNVTSFDVAIRQSAYFRCYSDGMFTCIVEKYLKATQALRRAHARDPHHPEVHVRIVQLARTGRSSAFTSHAYRRDSLQWLP